MYMRFTGKLPFVFRWVKGERAGTGWKTVTPVEKKKGKIV
jgi:hypothetical protein